MDRRGGLAVYVTSHGFGHLNRTVAVLNRLPADLPVTIRCHPDLFGHWRERLQRPAEFEAHVSDAGAVNPPGDSAATDGDATLARAARIHAEAMERVNEEARRLHDEGTAAVLCDAPPVPLVASSRAGVPGFLMGNFTWDEIYAPHARRLGGDAPTLVRDLRLAYRHATGVFRLEPGLPMRDIAPTIEVGMVVVPGRDRRDDLRRRLGFGADDKIVYLYVGRYGQRDLGWDRLASLRGIQFVGFHPPPSGPLPNVHVVPAEAFTGADLAASADAIVAKAGYGTVCEAIASGTPMIYPPRTGFAEHRVLDRALKTWGGGVPVASRAFAALKLGPALERAFALRPGPPPYPIDGADRIATHLMKTCRGAREAAG